jgi:glutathione synthase/RimK-type ligase-like ATP-grasp enzyme
LIRIAFLKQTVIFYALFVIEDISMYKTIVVADDPRGLPELGVEVINFDQYLADYPKKGESRTRIINLCDAEKYLSRGYYCSLLAESRQHQVLPSISTINDLRLLEEEKGATPLLLPKAPLEFKESAEFLVYFGWTPITELASLMRSLFERYPSPLIKVKLSPEPGGLAVQVARASLSELDARGRAFFSERLLRFTKDVWRSPSRRKYRWDMAILYDPAEANAPSDAEAIKRFVKAANKLGISTEVVASGQLKNLSQYDALFIRETTRIDHATYRLARKGEVEGLVVIDDPTSILRCCNKIFLHDAFSYNGISAPRTLVVANSGEDELNRIEASFQYPVVLKMPESSFSIGVYKLKSRNELKNKLMQMFQESSLALVQEYLPTEFDWRIGVLNGRAIYACKYFMARNHWQIYNHESGQKRYQSGGFATIPTFEAPRKVLKAALKASAVIGKGLYGVDIKQIEDQVYVIEVNDNPSIDHRVEDQYLGDELYMMIMHEFVERLEQRGRDKPKYA